MSQGWISFLKSLSPAIVIAVLIALGFTGCILIILLTLIIQWYTKEDTSPVPKSDFTVNIIGGGFAGICMGIRLKSMGVKYTIYEMAPSVGGVWWSNRYPGCACDIPSHLYSLSGELKADWSKQYPPREEILQYLQSVVQKHDLNIVYNTRCLGAKWHESQKMHSMELSTGETVWSHVLVSGFGGLREITLPVIPGIKEFKGTSFHSSYWDRTFDYSGKRVAVVGTGASAVQIVPGICKEVKELYVFQRTPTWSPKKFDFFFYSNVIKLFQTLPFAMRLYRNYLFFLHECRYFFAFRKNALGNRIFRYLMELRIKYVVKNPVVAHDLTPNYEPGCKRITPSDDYLNSFNRENVELVVSPITEITAHSVKTADGRSFEVDAIVFATGFSPLETGYKSGDLINAEGDSLAEVMGDKPIAYLGTCAERFPNAFSVLGPNTGLGHNSIVFMIECQVNYISQCIRYMIEQKKGVVMVKPSAMKRYKEYLEENMPLNVFYDGCKSWYRNKDGTGEHYVLWPSSCMRYWWMTRKWNPNDYIFD